MLLDVLANNADRKAGHVILGANDDRLWAIDNGLTFHVDEKLRTVLWPFAGEILDPAELAEIDALRATDWRSELGELLAPEELEAFAARIDRLLTEPVFPPEPEDRYAYPWPPV